MGNFFKSRKFRIILCIVALLIGIMLYCVTRDGKTLPTTGFIGSIVNPIRSASNSISNSIENTLKSITDAKETRKENAELRSRIAELENELIDYRATQEELEDLQKFMDVKEEHPEDTLSNPCNIIGYVENDPFHSFYIDRGSNDGISVYDPVVTGEGLVGVISEVASTYATVETLCNPSLSIGVTCLDKNEAGIVEGDLSLTANYRCHMIYLDKDTTLEKGDILLTGDSVGIFPSGYLIGSVISIEPMDSELSYSAIIEPAVDFENLTSVVVITDFVGKETRDAESQ